jgi:hypothetical protein
MLNRYYYGIDGRFKHGIIKTERKKRLKNLIKLKLLPLKEKNLMN